MAQVEIPARQLCLTNTEDNLKSLLLALELGYATDNAGLLLKISNNSFLNFASLFIVEDSTTFSDIVEAINKHRTVLKVATITGGRKIIFRPASMTSTSVDFVGYSVINNAPSMVKQTMNSNGEWGEITQIIGGEGSTYTAGNGIQILNSKILARLGKGLEFFGTEDGQKSIQIKLGKGLKFDDASGVEGTLAIDDIAQEVIDQVQEMSSDLDKKITTTFNYAQITDMKDFAPFGVTNTTRLIGQIFAVPIATELRLNETLISVRALQNYSGKLSFGIFEFDFDSNDGAGSTTWLCDTGVVSIKAGENQMPLKHLKATSEVDPSIKMVPGKLYYATILIAGDAPTTGLYLAADEPYAANYNAIPKYTMIASNMDSYVNWSDGSQEGTWFQGYNEFHEVPRLFMMIRNSEAAPPVPAVDPFRNYESFSVNHAYRVKDIFSLSIGSYPEPVVYQKVIPATDVTITDIGYCDYHGEICGSDVPMILNNEYTGIINFSDSTCTIGNNDGTKIDGTHYYHQFHLNTPLKLGANEIYWFPASMNLSNGNDDWIITYSMSGVTDKDLLLFDSKHNINTWAVSGGHAEYKNTQPGTLCRVIDSEGKEYTF